MKKTKRVSIVLVALIFTTVYISPIGVVFAKPSSIKTDGNNTVSSSEVASALTKTSGILEASDQVAVSSDQDSSLKAKNQNATIDVPKDASEGVTLDGVSSPAIKIYLPNADKSADAKNVASGVIAFEGKNGSASAVQATENGAVRMLTVIDNFNAPTQYDYKVTIPSGGSIRLTKDGGAKVLDNSSQPIAFIDRPWAKDGVGNNIKTYFTTDG